MKDIILCDIDGTIADNSHRQDLLKNFKDWDSFFSEMGNDKPIKAIIKKINDDFERGSKIIFITGRPERYREKTFKWLSKYFNFSIEILMRNDDDKRNKVIVKEEMLSKFKKGQNIVKVYENDPDLIKLWKKNKLKVFKVT